MAPLPAGLLQCGPLMLFSRNSCFECGNWLLVAKRQQPRPMIMMTSNSKNDGNDIDDHGDQHPLPHPMIDEHGDQNPLPHPMIDDHGDQHPLPRPMIMMTSNSRN